MKYHDKELLKLEELVRAGDFASVKKILHDTNSRKIHREHLGHYANIANRVDQPRFAHRILQNIVRANKPTKNPASENEKIEYAEALRLMGLNEEAKKILNEIDPSQYPIVHLRMAFCFIVKWKYAEAIPCLENYIHLTDPKNYMHLVARVNLAAALINQRRYEDALSLLLQLEKETKIGQHRLLNANCLELMSQVFIRQNLFEHADRTLEEATKLMGDSPSRFSLYLKKWKAISQGQQTNSVPRELLECRQIASQNMDWETVRDCDLYVAYLSKDQALLNQVYFGTPYGVYRKKIIDLLDGKMQVPATYIWSSKGSEPPAEVFDLVAGRNTVSEVQLEIGHLTHRLLILLCSDFYRPLSICSAFSELFPEENFSQTGSANRVIQIVKRLRIWASKNGNPFTIEEQDGYYRLKMAANQGVLVPQEMPALSLQSVTWKMISSRLQLTTLFSKQDVVKNLECSKASAERILRWAVENGQVNVIGDGPQRKYRRAS